MQTKTPASPTTAAPERSLAQRLEALDKGNRIRTTRADWKKDVKARRASALDVLLAPPEDFETMKVLDVMLAMPKIGRVKASKVLRDCRVSPSKTIGGLTGRQRTELVSLLRPSMSGSRGNVGS